MERAHLVGIVEWTVQCQADALVFLIRPTKPLSEEVGPSILLYGYRDDISFDRMPKLRIRFGPIFHEVYDGHRKGPEQACSGGRKVIYSITGCRQASYRACAADGHPLVACP